MVVPARVELASLGLQPSACTISASEPLEPLPGVAPSFPLYKSGTLLLMFQRRGASDRIQTCTARMEVWNAIVNITLAWILLLITLSPS